jgi:hypothetical protein
MNRRVVWLGGCITTALVTLFSLRWLIIASAHTPGLTTTSATESNVFEPVVPPPSLFPVSTGANPASPAAPAETTSLLDSSVTGGGIFSCYEPGQTQTLCFTVHNASSDNEWITGVRMTFPQLLGDWVVSCNIQDPTDSLGNPVDMSCSNSFPYEVRYIDNDSDGLGEIISGASWSFCVDAAIPSGYVGPRLIHWQLDGDGDGVEPHTITGTIEQGQCAPLMIEPEYIAVEGCNGLPQNHDFAVWNNTGSSGTFNFIYEVPRDNASFYGPDSVPLPAGGILTFTAVLTPSVFLRPGEVVTAALIVEGNANSDVSLLVKTISDFAGWLKLSDIPTATMDNAVVWASHSDGGLWSIGGYDSKGAVQRYDPASDSWSIHTAEISPTIEYPMDGCYGLDSQGHEVVVLFPEPSGQVTSTLHRYDITDDHWDAPALPVGFPGARWSQDIVSLLNVTGENVCYLSGGAITEGGGGVKNLWEYYPDTNITIFLGNYSHHPEGFNFHASWYVPWIGAQGAICVAGGIDINGVSFSDSQCYLRQEATFNAPNADLGQLPTPWWGMADGWQVQDGRYQIWLANGVSQNGALLPATAYADEVTGGFVYGPEVPIGLYRLEGDGFDGRFYTEGGSKSGFQYSGYNLLLTRCPECFYLNLPVVIKKYNAP